MENLTIYNKFRVVPKEAQKEIIGGRLKGFTDINPMWRIKTLTEQFGLCGFGWKYEIISQELREGGNKEFAAFVTINLFVKVDEKWSEAIPGLGGSSFVTNETKGLYTSDECFKMAFTDALSVACKSLGMGADVYFGKDRTKYDVQAEVVQPKTPTAPKVVATPPTPLAFDKAKYEAEIAKITTKAELGKYWSENKAVHCKEFNDLLNAHNKKLTQ